MVEIGEIKKTSKNGWCTVRFPRKTACENCRMCLKPKEEMFVELKVRNTLDAKEGDRVSVSVGDRAVVSASMIVYLIPLALLAIALGATSVANDLALSLGCAGGALILGFGIVALIDKKLKKKNEFSPRLTAILTDNTDEQKTNRTADDADNTDTKTE
jgi:positive regulator of sigma E activity